MSNSRWTNLTLILYLDIQALPSSTLIKRWILLLGKMAKPRFQMIRTLTQRYGIRNLSRLTWKKWLLTIKFNKRWSLSKWRIPCILLLSTESNQTCLKTSKKPKKSFQMDYKIQKIPHLWLKQGQLKYHRRKFSLLLIKKLQIKFKMPNRKLINLILPHNKLKHHNKF